MARRKQFSEFATGLVSRFVSRNNDIGGFWGVGILAKALHAAEATDVTFDLLGAPDRLDGGSGEWLRRRMSATGMPPTWLASATLRVVISPTQEEQSGEASELQSWRAIPGVPVHRVTATAAIVDERGDEWRATATTWCRDHDPRYELRSRRPG